jgi:xanthine/uracil permease
LLYAADERPPPFTLLLLGVQHAATAMAFIAYVLVAARLANLDQSATQNLVAISLLGMALATALQVFGGRLGSGLLLVHMPDPFMIALGATLLASHGQSGLASATLIYAISTLAIAPLVRYLRPIFPPSVVGTVICIGGLGLMAPSLRQSLGLEQGQWQPDGASALIAAVTLGSIVVLSIWGRKSLRIMSVLLAMAAGIGLAILLGKTGHADSLQTAPLLAMPQISTPEFNLDIGMIAATILVAVLTQLDTLGSVTMMEKMEDADWKRANMHTLSGGIRANGLGDLCMGLLGSFPTCTCSANIALAYATRCTSRYIGLVTAGLLALAAFLPQLTLALTLIPVPVLGAIGLYAACFLMVSGMELAMSRAIDSRTIFAVGLSIGSGVAMMQMPQLAQQAPEALRLMLSESFVITGLVVILLNLVFRLGTSQEAERSLKGIEHQHLQHEIIGFVESQGAIWGARRPIVQRAALAALEAAEAIQNAGAERHISAITGRFDEFNLDIELCHSGPTLPLPSHAPGSRPDHSALLDADEDAIEQALMQASGRLLRHLADRVTSGVHAGESVLRLHFEH